MAKNSYEQDQVENKQALIIKEVEKNSIGEEMGLEPGDIITAINGEPVIDELDYIFLTSADEFVLEVKTKSEEIWELEIEVEEGESMGLTFYDTLSAKSCSNHCLFCFIDQMPPGMRESLYVKDDDERLSFLTGNYITLTNLNESELKRICRWKIPVNISVHTTDPILRRKMLGNVKASEINETLARLKKAGVKMNAQIVLVPELNDKTLAKTLEDLSELYPELESVSVVPVGLTKFREKLAPLRLFTIEEAKEVVELIENFQKRMLNSFGSAFVYASDEFYLLAQKPIPEAKTYEGFKQLENGVGMMALFREEVLKAADEETSQGDKKRRLALTGTLAAPFLKELLKELKNFELNVEVVGVNNHFFGKNITVAGLLTGQDIIEKLKEMDLTDCDEILIPEALFRNKTETLLDDLTRLDIEKTIGIPVRSVSSDGRSFFKAILGD